jgi:hypothetical protein
MDKEHLLTLKRDELVKLCVEHKKPKSGTKADLIARLLGDPVEPKSKPKKKANTIQKNTLQQLEAHIQKHTPVILIERNQHGQFQHIESGLVFDPQTKKVIGKSSGSEALELLDLEDLEVCHKYHFQYEDASVARTTRKTDEEEYKDLQERLESAK